MAVFTTRDGLALGSKTPVSILQEVLQKKGLTPHYELVYNGVGLQEPRFKFQVSAEGQSAIGDGKSKKEAKHDAAASLLKRLLTKKEESATESWEEAKELEHVDIASPYTNALKTNFVGMLDEICVVNKFPYAFYELVLEEGPPHARVFTMRCVVSSVSEVAVARTKKQAKHLVAQKMVERLSSIMGKRFVPLENAENAEEVVSDQEKIRNGSFQHDLSHKVKDLHNVFHSRLDEQPLAKVFKELPEKEEAFYERMEKPVEFLETVVKALEGVLKTNYVTVEELRMSLNGPVGLLEEGQCVDAEDGGLWEDETDELKGEENGKRSTLDGNSYDQMLPDFPISDDEEDCKTENVALDRVRGKEVDVSDSVEKVKDTGVIEDCAVYTLVKVEVPRGRWEFSGKGRSDSDALEDAARSAIKFLRAMAIPPPEDFL